MPADKADTLKLAPKSIDDAVPTRVPSSLIMTPDPVATIPVRPEPSPTKDVAVNVPTTLAPPITCSFDVGFVVPMPTLPEIYTPNVVVAVPI